MKKITMLTCAALLIGTAKTDAQVSNNGLVGCYKFSGNANDESGNLNHGILNGATPTTDRFGNSNCAYSFNGIDNYIEMPSGTSTSVNITGDLTLSFWLKTAQNTSLIISLGDNIFVNNGGYITGLNGGNVGSGKMGFATLGVWNGTNTLLDDNNWHNTTIVLKADTLRMYIDNMLDLQQTGVAAPLSWNGTRAIGCRSDFVNGFFDGVLDDIRIYNRAINTNEVAGIFNEKICSETIYDTLHTVVNDTNFVTDTLLYSVFDTTITHLVINDSIFHNIFDTTHVIVSDSIHHNIYDTLITNIVIRDTIHYSVFDTIVNHINVFDTLVVTHFDTIHVVKTDTSYISVTDTLFIYMTVGISPPLQANTIKAYPNPTQGSVTIDNGNYNLLAGYKIKITNNLGQQVFMTDITQQQYMVNLDNLGGKGLYYLQILNNQNQVVENRKIVLD